VTVRGARRAGACVRVRRLGKRHAQVTEADWRRRLTGLRAAREEDSGSSPVGATSAASRGAPKEFGSVACVWLEHGPAWGIGFP
jgi:hypothetical protein